MTCDNGSSCTSCIGIVQTGILSRILPNCTCDPAVLDVYPTQLDCQPAVTCTSSEFLNASALCEPCNQGCATCSDNTQCDTCIGLIQTGSQARNLPDCSCSPGYNDLYPNETDCQPIVCTSGFYLDTSTYNCTACNTTCDTCNNTFDCLTCIGNASIAQQDRLPPTCDCQQGFVDVTPTNDTCQMITCPSGQYLNDTTWICTPCSAVCATCNNSTACTTCVANATSAQVRVTPNCACPSGYYDLLPGSTDCTTCGTLCATCTNGTACTTCIGSVTTGQQARVAPACGC